MPPSPLAWYSLVSKPILVNRFWMKASNSLGVSSRRLGRLSMSEMTSIGSTMRGSAMLNGMTGSTGMSSSGCGEMSAKKYLADALDRVELWLVEDQRA